VESSFDLPGLRPATAGGHPLTIQVVGDGEISAPDPTAQPIWRTRIDGRPYAMWGGDGYTMVHSGSAAYALSADLRTLRCSPVDAADPGWRRFVLDTVLWSVSLLRGFELLHAAAVEGPAGVVAIAAGSGGGKSSVALELLRRGADLFCDDILALAPTPRGGVLAHPGPALMNLPVDRAPDDSGAFRELARFGDESWIVLPTGAATPRPVTAICLLERSPGATTELRPIEATGLHLLPHSLGFDHLDDRPRARFELFSTLAAAPILSLTADPDASPAVLADMLEPLLAPTPAAIA
jgi:hypothetical protein